ncbi:abnormal spindle-like microcephaly-associated protein homolog [Schistocerca gregaria]|uniref:abnormal spindle-like microcephaly-associated protein homolog n=1 Tax=Schistocerca gregaria TaxID=7010 RepID=UPI00211EAD78|nr:abnormal spindle-like microcephaly-associated protein homolog [Schistocerca gregaria]
MSLTFEEPTDDVRAIMSTKRRRRQKMERESKLAEEAISTCKFQDFSESISTPVKAGSSEGYSRRIYTPKLKFDRNGMAIQEKELNEPYCQLQRIKKKILDKVRVEQSEISLLNETFEDFFYEYGSNEYSLNQQEDVFLRWINYMLTLKCEFEDSSEVLLPSYSSVRVSPHCIVYYPTRASVQTRALDLLRQKKSMFRKIKERVVLEEIAIAEDKSILEDFGMRQHFVELLLNYSNDYLIIALEALFQDQVCTTSVCSQAALEQALSKYIVQHFASNAMLESDIFDLPSKAEVKMTKSAMDKHILINFLALVWLLEQLKVYSVLTPRADFELFSFAHASIYGGRLFKMNAAFKSSAEIVYEFSRQFLTGEGDVLRHLRAMEYVVEYQQMQLDEYVFSAENLECCFRDGVRLCGLAEILCVQMGKKPSRSIFSSVRLPITSSTLRKVHNASLALEELRKCNIFPAGVAVQDIVNGNRLKTHSLIWAMVLSELSCLISVETLSGEIELLSRELALECPDWQKNLSESLDEGSGMGYEPSTCTYFNQELFDALLKWSQVVCSRFNYPVRNFRSSFGDWRAFCYLVYHYVPEYISLSAIRTDTMMELQGKICRSLFRSESEPCSLDSDMLTMLLAYTHVFHPRHADAAKQNHLEILSKTCSVYRQAKSAEYYNYRLMIDAVEKMGCIPPLVRLSEADWYGRGLLDEKVFVMQLVYLCVRLLQLRRERPAAVEIQRAVRARWRAKVNRTVRKFQEAVRLVVEGQRLRCACEAVVTRVYARREKEKFRNLVEGAKAIQNGWRRRQLREEARRLRACVKDLQSLVRSTRDRDAYCRVVDASVRIQACWATRVRKRRYIEEIESGSSVQTAYRRYRERRVYLELRSSLGAIGRQARGASARRAFERGLAARRVSTRWRTKRVRAHYLKCVCAVCDIQAAWRRKAKSSREALEGAVLAVETRWRSVLSRREFKLRRECVLCIERRRQSIEERRKYLRFKNSIVYLQSLEQHRRTYCLAKRLSQVCRTWAEKEHKKREYRETIGLSLVVQATSWARHARLAYEELRRAVVLVQLLLRSREEKVRYGDLRNFVYDLQAFAAALNAHMEHVRLRSCVVAIGYSVRARGDRKHYERVKSAAALMGRQSRVRQDQVAYSETRRSIEVLVASLSRRDCMNAYSILGESVKSLQRLAAVRSCRSRYISSRHFATLIQGLARARCNRESYTLLTNSLVGLQCLAKLRHQKAVYVQMKDLAGAVQQLSRSRASRSWFCDLTSLTGMIQCLFRGKLLQSGYLEVREAAERIRWRVRVRSQHALHISLVGSCTFLQYRIRGGNEREAYCRLKSCVYVVQRFWRGRGFKASHGQLKGSVVILQSSARRLSCSSVYDRLRHLVIILQCGLRRKNHVTEYGQLRGAIEPIQRAFKTRHDRDLYLQRRKLSALFQRLLENRANWLQYQFHRLSTRVLQCKIRLFLEKRARSNAVDMLALVLRSKCSREEYDHIRRAAVDLQAWVRASCIHVPSILDVKLSAVLIQSQCRGAKCRLDYNQMRNLVIALQSVSRQRSLHQIYAQERRSIRTLQQAYRQQSYCRQSREWIGKFLEMSRLIRTLDRFWTLDNLDFIVRQGISSAFGDGSHSDKNFVPIHHIELAHQHCTENIENVIFTQSVLHFQSAVRLLSARRVYSHSKKCAPLFQRLTRMHGARSLYCNTIFSVGIFQRLISVKKQQKDFSHLKHCCLLIRTRLQGKNQRNAFSELTQAVRSLLKIIRAWQITQKQQKFISSAVLFRQASIAYPYHHLYLLQSRIRHQYVISKISSHASAIVLLQAACRTLYTRQHYHYHFDNIRRSIAHYLSSLQVTQTLGYQTQQAIHVLVHGTKQHDLTLACNTLEFSTRYSKSCCHHIIRLNAISTFFDVIQACNRSMPHLKLIEVILCVVANILRFQELAYHVWMNYPRFLDSQFDLMHKFKGTPDIFLKAAKLFYTLSKLVPSSLESWLFGNSSSLPSLRSTHSLEKLTRSVQNAIQKMQMLSEYLQRRLSGEVRAKKHPKLILCTKESICAVQSIIHLFQLKLGRLKSSN